MTRNSDKKAFTRRYAADRSLTYTQARTRIQTAEKTLTDPAINPYLAAKVEDCTIIVGAQFDWDDLDDANHRPACLITPSSADALPALLMHAHCACGDGTCLGITLLFAVTGTEPHLRLKDFDHVRGTSVGEALSGIPISPAAPGVAQERAFVVQRFFGQEWMDEYVDTARARDDDDGPSAESLATLVWLMTSENPQVRAWRTSHPTDVASASR